MMVLLWIYRNEKAENVFQWLNGKLLSQFNHDYGMLINSLLNSQVKSILSVGSRDDAEVLSFIEQGFDCTGIDIEDQKHIKK